MTKRLPNFATTMCAIACVLLLAAAAAALLRGSHLPFVSLGRHLHISVTSGAPFGPHLLICNDKDYGPRCGSITVGVSGASSPQVSGFDGLPGVYYQHIRWPSHSLWGLRISLGYPLALLGVPPLVWCVREFLRRRNLVRRGFEVLDVSSSS